MCTSYLYIQSYIYCCFGNGYILFDSKWLETEFLTTVNKHQRTVRKKLQHSLGISEANGICTVLHRWYHDSPPGEIMSLGVLSEGSVSCAF